jgi:hypothetical protein
MILIPIDSIAYDGYSFPNKKIRLGDGIYSSNKVLIQLIALKVRQGNVFFKQSFVHF